MDAVFWIVINFALVISLLGLLSWIHGYREQRRLLEELRRDLDAL